MPNKSLSIYSSDDFTLEGNFHLVIEIAKNHLACIVAKANKKTIAAFELFSFQKDEGEKFNELLSAITQQSRLLSIKASSVSIYINSEYCVPVPIFNFNKETAAEYLQIVGGQVCFSKVQYEHLPVESGIINVYQVPEDCFNWFTERFEKCTFHHTYSNTIRRILSLPDPPEELITVHFYSTFLIVAVIKNGSLQLIQTFVYENPDDVLYYLLNVTKQLHLYNKDLAIQISGMIDVDYKLYREIITYFKGVKVENVNGRHSKLDFGEYPHHYFTPFFNLVQ